MSATQMRNTGSGLILGTPDFMSPEQALGDGREIGPRSDMWSVAATFYMLVSGEPLHASSSLVEHLRALTTTKPRPLAALVPSVPVSISSVIERALSLELDARWPGVSDMKAAMHLAAIDVPRPRRVLPGDEPGLVVATNTPTIADPLADVGDDRAVVRAKDLNGYILSNPPPAHDLRAFTVPPEPSAFARGVSSTRTFVVGAIVLAVALVVVVIAVANIGEQRERRRVDRKEAEARAREILRSGR
jgi:serine/threonine protein kinase